MYIAAKPQTKPQEPLLRCMSEQIQKMLANVTMDGLEEIRLRRQKPLVLDYGVQKRYLTPQGRLCEAAEHAYIVTDSDIERSLVLACGGSVYACQEQIRNGYVTLAGGHRIGLVGSTVLEGGAVKFIKEISGMNFRFARQINGAADAVMPEILKDGAVKSTLVLSPPGCGKTTLLRDIVRQLSAQGVKSVIVDERSELAAVANGVCGYDVGVMTDVLDACPKAAGMMMAVRSMSPQAVVTDEIGNAYDIAAIKNALRCGVSVVASAHASDARSLYAGAEGQALCRLFEVFVTLSKRRGSGTIEEVCTYETLVHRAAGVRKLC